MLSDFLKLNGIYVKKISDQKSIIIIIIIIIILIIINIIILKFKTYIKANIEINILNRK